MSASHVRDFKEEAETVNNKPAAEAVVLQVGAI